MLEILWTIFISVFLVGIVYLVGNLIDEIIIDGFTTIRKDKNKKSKNEEVFSAQRFADNFVLNPKEYYKRKVKLSGEVTEITTDITNQQKIELDGTVLCDFTEPQKNIEKGMNIKISGLCMGRIITGCKIEAE